MMSALEHLQYFSSLHVCSNTYWSIIFLGLYPRKYIHTHFKYNNQILFHDLEHYLNVNYEYVNV